MRRTARRAFGESFRQTESDNAASVLEDLNERIECILQGEQTEIGVESNVVDCTGEKPVVLRVGSVSFEELQTIVPETTLAETGSALAARSPGTRYKHYSPRAKVVLVQSPKSRVQSPASSAFIGLKKPEQNFKLQKICANAAEYAHELFEFFRECDRAEIEIVYCQTVAENNFGRALMDRLRRSSAD